jgi:hypothetical protein
MNKKLLAGLASIGLLTGGGSAAAFAAAGATAAAVTPAAVASSASGGPSCGPLEPLVAKGTITHAQATAIHNAFITYMHDHWQAIVATVLGQQVKNHTITKSQAGSVGAAITAWVQHYQSHGSGQHALCHHEGMMGGSGS